MTAENYPTATPPLYELPEVVQPAPAAEAQPLGTADPAIRMLATDPTSLSDSDRQATLTEAKLKAAGAPRVTVFDKEGRAHVGKEYPEVFTFDGQVRGMFERVNQDPDKLSTGQELALVLGGQRETRGKMSDVIFETDDGQMIRIARTNDRLSAEFQEFELTSTSQQPGPNGEPAEPMKIDTSMLKGVAVVPGEPMVLGVDPATGKTIRTRGNIISITAFDMSDDGVLPDGHPLRKYTELERDTVQRIEARMAGGQAEQVDAGQQQPGEQGAEAEPQYAQAAGPGKVALGAEVQLVEQSTNPYEQMTNDQLEQVRNNIADSVVRGLLSYNPQEVTRASANLAAIQREFETRFPELLKTLPRGQGENGILYDTLPDPNIVRSIVDKLKDVDGIAGIVFGIRNKAAAERGPSGRQPTLEEVLQATELERLLSEVGRGIQDVTPGKEKVNPYSDMPNNELDARIEQFKTTIAEQTAAGKDTTELRKNLALIGQVINARKQAD